MTTTLHRTVLASLLLAGALTLAIGSRANAAEMVVAADAELAAMKHGAAAEETADAQPTAEARTVRTVTEHTIGMPELFAAELTRAAVAAAMGADGEAAPAADIAIHREFRLSRGGVTLAWTLDRAGSASTETCELRIGSRRPWTTVNGAWQGDRPSARDIRRMIHRLEDAGVELTGIEFVVASDDEKQAADKLLRAIDRDETARVETGIEVPRVQIEAVARGL